jgi:tetratricopeptide (TPR) repeat protein
LADTARVAELRRRVQADPTSIAFAQLAEELRRAGANEEAVAVCRAGLARHPGYLSARVTMGRALIELGELDEALAELSTVASAAPDNLAAMRGLAEIHQRRGELTEALDYYRRALDLARHDPELEEAVERMEKEVTPPEPAPEAPVSIEALFDFDTLVGQLGAEEAGPPAIPSAEEWASVKASFPAADHLSHLAGDLDAQDSLAALELGLRAREAAQAESLQAQGEEATEVDPAIAELEDWLAAIEREVR